LFEALVSAKIHKIYDKSVQQSCKTVIRSAAKNAVKRDEKVD